MTEEEKAAADRALEAIKRIVEALVVIKTARWFNEMVRRTCDGGSE